MFVIKFDSAIGVSQRHMIPMSPNTSKSYALDSDGTSYTSALPPLSVGSHPLDGVVGIVLARESY